MILLLESFVESLNDATANVNQSVLSLDVGVYNHEKLLEVQNEFISFSSVVDGAAAHIAENGHVNGLMSIAPDDAIILFEYIMYKFTL